METLIAIALLAIVTLLSTGCMACPTAFADGVLVDAGETLVLQAQSGEKNRIVWASGYRVEERSGKLVLVDWLGGVKARQGDHIQVGGGVGTDDLFHACGDIVVVPL
jgi:hypothetical protein